MSPPNRANRQLFRRVALMAILLNVALALLGLLLYPTSMSQGAWPGLFADLLILLVFGGLAFLGPFGAGRLALSSLWLGLISGLIGGLLMTLDLLSGHLFAPTGQVSQLTSLTAYGLFALLIFASAFVAARRANDCVSGLGAAFWCIMSGELIWFFVEFSCYYLLGGTPNGSRFVEGEMAVDFARSGATDYAGWVMADFYGAGFFHPLLSLILGGLLAAAGAGVGRVSRAMGRRR